MCIYIYRGYWPKYILFGYMDPYGHLRQGFPMAFIMEQAGGAATCGLFKGAGVLNPQHIRFGAQGEKPCKT